MYDNFDEITGDEGLAKRHIRAMAKDEIIRRYKSGERDFSGIIAPNSDFSGADLRGIIFRRAKLAHSSFKNCNIRNADFSFAEAQDTGFENANAEGANFSDAILFNSNFCNARVTSAVFHNANIADCNFGGCDKKSADFSGASHNSVFGGAVMAAEKIIREYGLGRRDFSGVVAPNSDFSGQDLRGIILRKANLHFSSFNHTDLTAADLSGADLTDCAFGSTILRNANLSKANLWWSRIKKAIMENANLSDANISWCDLSETDFGACDISKANLQWSLAIKTKLSDSQFFSLSPDVLETMKFAHSDTAIEVKRNVSVSQQNSYIVKQGSEKSSHYASLVRSFFIFDENKKYAQGSGNVQIYGSQMNEKAAIYSPKGKKEIGRYKNLE